MRFPPLSVPRRSSWDLRKNAGRGKSPTVVHVCAKARPAARRRVGLCLLMALLQQVALLLFLLHAARSTVAGVPGPIIGYPIVNTTLGQLRGVTQEYEGRPLHAFRGIRYTDQPPVNARRFLRSHLVNESWIGVRNATGYGAVCIQNPADVSKCSLARVFASAKPFICGSPAHPLLARR
jgi:hypothetical protein